MCSSSRAERLVNEHLTSDGATFTREWRDARCCDKLPLPFDFVIGKWFCSVVQFILELDGSQHFDDRQHGPSAFALNRAHDLYKMRWALSYGIPVVRLTSRTVEYFNSSTWKTWLAHVRDEHVVPLTGRPVEQRKLIILQDTPRYRQMYEECMENDPELVPYVAFVGI